MLRKIKTRNEVERAKKRNQIIVGGILVFLMLVSILGYSLMSGGNSSDEYKKEFGINFIKNNGVWKTKINYTIFGFNYLPSEVNDIFVSGNYSFGDYSGETLYFVNPNNGVPEILNNLEAFILRYQEACLLKVEVVDGKNTINCKGDLPLKGCDNNMIIFEEGDESMVWKENNCVHIVGDGVRGADAFLYKALKIS